ncbi:MAG: leucine-rich repeat domain-containing protein [Dehalococcoidia bacterium]|nr:leucine-rich repeat domain-containing protein [Dehalococcoidia bacterium]
MKIRRSVWAGSIGIILAALAFASVSFALEKDQSLIPDPRLQRAILYSYGMETGENLGDISKSNLAKIRYIWGSNAGITDLSGLEYCVNLEMLMLSRNNITDISPVASLSKLTYLDIIGNEVTDISPIADLKNLTHFQAWVNNISDLTPLANLTGLTDLALLENNVSDISPLAGLTNLESLCLLGNQISDISILANLTNLKYLSLNDNKIGDISALASLTNLESLSLEGNEISDLSPLLLNDGLGIEYANVPGSGDKPSPDPDTVDLTGNPLNGISVGVYIPQLEERGVEVTR